MLLDWILREGWMLPVWWSLVTIAGLTVLPLSLRLLHSLPDKGYTMARTLGMLLIGFAYWLLTSFGFTQNSVGGIVFAWLVVLIISLFAFFKLGSGFDWRGYWRENSKVIIAAEILFIMLFAFMMTYRAFNPDTSTTEKPMEMNFLSGILRSDTFPPNDAWLSGYAISYYHFGYIMAAMLTMLSGVSNGFGFSMSIALWFALTGLTVFGVAYNLVRSRAYRIGTQLLNDNVPSRQVSMLSGLCAVFFVLWMGNLQVPLIEAPYQSENMPASYFNYWGVKERTITETPDIPFQQNSPLVLDSVNEWGFWWWFRASRVVTDYDINGNAVEVIDEFPSFSYVLGDLHPHVLAYPFVALVIGLALNIILTWREPDRYQIILYGIAIGGLIFLNTWDGPIWLAALVGADALRRILRFGRLSLDDWLALAFFGLQIVVIAVIAYLPFLISFRSQASGFLPNLIYPTAFQRLFLMFGLQMLILIPFLITEMWRGNRLRRMNWMLGITVSLSILLVLAVVLILFIGLATVAPSMQSWINTFIAQNGGWGSAIQTMLTRRATHFLTTFILLLGITVIIARLFPKEPNFEDNQPEAVTYPAATGLTLLLIAIGIMLILIPEFIYLRDNFGSRMNTIFKFYYQAWMVFGIASAYCVYSILGDARSNQPPKMAQFAFSVGLVSVFLLGSAYPIAAYYARGWVERGYAVQTDVTLTIDGTPRMVSADDYEALQCLANLVDGDNAVVAEAEQHAYNPAYGRVGSITGIPIVLGWRNHQGQWRGATYPQTVGSRSEDLRTLYTDLRLDIIEPIIERYSIDYIFYGTSERASYGEVGEEKFANQYEVVCESGATRVYRVIPTDIAFNN